MHSPRNAIRQYPPSPPLSHASHASNESLRALELTEGPIDISRNVRPGRSYSISGFDFQADLLPLSASLSEPDRGSEAGGEKSISLLNGEHVLLYYYTLDPFHCYKRYCTLRRAAGKYLSLTLSHVTGHQKRQIGSGIL